MATNEKGSGLFHGVKTTMKEVPMISTGVSPLHKASSVDRQQIKTPDLLLVLLMPLNGREKQINKRSIVCCWVDSSSDEDKTNRRWPSEWSTPSLALIELPCGSEDTSPSGNSYFSCPTHMRTAPSGLLLCQTQVGEKL